MKKSDPKKVVFIDYLKPKNWFGLALLVIARLIAFFPIRVIQCVGQGSSLPWYQHGVGKRISASMLTDGRGG